MRSVFIASMAIHALVHVIGFVKAFGFAAITQLTRPISAAVGLLWLGAALLIVAALIALVVWPKWWWALASVALVVSQVAIATSWADAKLGTLPNPILLLGVTYGFLTRGPTSSSPMIARASADGKNVSD